MGGEVDTFVASHSANIRGLLAFRIIMTLISATLSLRDTRPIYAANDFLTGFLNGATAKYRKDFRFSATATPGEISSSCALGGTFFPYFRSLIIPDKTFVPRFIIQHFGSILGGSQQQRSIDAILTIHDGWRSLATTDAGMAISHLVFCLDLALATGDIPKVVMSGSSYDGIVLLGSTTYVKGKVLHVPSSVVDLRSQVMGFSSHDVALGSLCTLISSVKTGNGLAEQVATAAITTPRQIHNLLRDRTFDNDQQGSIAKLLLKLNFNQTFWDPKDPRRMSQAVLSIGGGTFLPDEAPIMYTNAVMMTKDIITSTLLAFGSRAPTFSSKGEFDLVIPKDPSAFFTGKASALPGLPVFIMHIQQACESWKTWTRSGLFLFETATGKKKGVLNLRSVTQVLNKDAETTRQLCRDLSSQFSHKAQEKKAAKRTADQIEKGKEIEGKSGKRVKLARELGAGALSMFDSDMEQTEEEEEEEEMPFGNMDV